MSQAFPPLTSDDRPITVRIQNARSGAGGWFGALLGTLGLAGIAYGSYLWIGADKFSLSSASYSGAPVGVDTAFTKIGAMDRTYVNIPVQGTSAQWTVDGNATTNPKVYNSGSLANVLALTLRWGLEGAPNFKTKTFVADFGTAGLDAAFAQFLSGEGITPADAQKVDAVYFVHTGNVSQIGTESGALQGNAAFVALLLLFTGGAIMSNDSNLSPPVGLAFALTQKGSQPEVRINQTYQGSGTTVITLPVSGNTSPASGTQFGTFNSVGDLVNAAVNAFNSL